MSQIALVIPARYNSKRLPGKPLIKIAGTEMIKRVAAIAESIVRKNDRSFYLVATDDERIRIFCQDNEIPVVMTSPDCENGTTRCREAIEQLEEKPELVINLQGDNPLCPPHVIQALINSWKNVPGDVFTPCVHLSWNEYDALCEAKKTTPYSGTTVLTDRQGYAMVFSKAVLPLIRDEAKARAQMEKSPVRRHVGLYAYSYDALNRYIFLPPTLYGEDYLEALEQLRFLENGMKVKMVDVDYRGRRTTSGVDSPEDIKRVEDILKEFGEPDLSL